MLLNFRIFTLGYIYGLDSQLSQISYSNHPAVLHDHRTHSVPMKGSSATISHDLRSENLVVSILSGRFQDGAKTWPILPKSQNAFGASLNQQFQAFPNRSYIPSLRSSTGAQRSAVTRNGAVLGAS